MSRTDFADVTVISIGGAPSSGTTLLADLVDSVPGMACDPEIGIFTGPEAFGWDPGFVVRAIDSASLTATSWYAAPRPFFNAKYLDVVGLDGTSLAEMIRAASSLPEFVDRYRGHRAEVRGRPIKVLADKTPANVATAGLFLDTFPQGLFVHVVRDPRQSVASLLGRGFGLAEATATWAQQAARGLAVAGHPRVVTIDYQDLTSRPFEIVAGLARRVGIEATPERIRSNFEDNEFRSALPRVASWRVADYDGRVVAAVDKEIEPMQAGWVERQAIWRCIVGDEIAYLGSVGQIADRLGFPSRAVPKARFTVERLSGIFNQFARARAAYDQVCCVTEPKFVTGFDDRLPTSVPSDVRHWLDGARPWVGNSVIQQMGLQASARHALRRKRIKREMAEQGVSEQPGVDRGETDEVDKAETLFR